MDHDGMGGVHDRIQASFEPGNAMALCLCILVCSSAWAFDLTGAWATAEAACPKVFLKDGNKVSLTADSDIFDCRPQPPMELLLALIYVAFCVVIFKLFRIPVN